MKSKQTILIVDDSLLNRELLSDILYQYAIYEADDGKEAIDIIHSYQDQISLILLDVSMPKMDGFDVLDYLNKNQLIEKIPVMIISVDNDPETIEKAFSKGVVDYITRPFSSKIILNRVKNTLMIYAKQKMLISLVSKQVTERQRSNNIMSLILSHIVESRNGESGLHVLNVRMLTQQLLKVLMEKTDRYHLSHKDINEIATASTLHDIGKMVIPESILNKPSKLTDQEMKIMQSHAIEGAKMIKDLPFYQNDHFVEYAYQICRWHHERFDGRGYPDGLKGDDIPIAAQVVSLADAYDALTSIRVYKKAFDHQVALQMIKEGQCGQFNPLLLECLMSIEPAIKKDEIAHILSENNKQDIENEIRDLLNDGQVFYDDGTLQMIDYDHEKTDFFYQYSKEIRFEYSIMPPVLHLSKWGSQQLQLPEKISNPLIYIKDHHILDDKQLDELKEKVKHLSFYHPICKHHLCLNTNDKQDTLDLVIRGVFDRHDRNRLTHILATSNKEGR